MNQNRPRMTQRIELADKDNKSVIISILSMFIIHKIGIDSMLDIADEKFSELKDIPKENIKK